MASVQKFTASAVPNELRHNNRQIKNNSNQDIRADLSHLNYDLTPDHGKLTHYQYYKHRLSELYHYNRADVKTLAGWVVTLPSEISMDDREHQRKFFEAVSDFLSNRYGSENVIQSIVHCDEGIRRTVAAPDGTVSEELVAGRPHLHFCFIPVVPDKTVSHVQTEKVCAYKVLTTHELHSAHVELQKHLDSLGIEAKVINGATGGVNRTVGELKETTRLRLELEQLRQKNVELQQEIERLHERNRNEGVHW